MSSHSILKIQKITFVAGFFYPRDGCLLHLSKIIFCICFGVKLCQKSSSGIMLIHRCCAQCEGPRNVTRLFLSILHYPLRGLHVRAGNRLYLLYVFACGFLCYI